MKEMAGWPILFYMSKKMTVSVVNSLPVKKLTVSLKMTYSYRRKIEALREETGMIIEIGDMALM